MKSFTRSLAIVAVFFCTETVNADSWLPPKVTDYYSQDSTYFVRVYPRHIPDNYFKWLEAKPRKKKKFAPSDTIVTPCYAQLFKRLTSGDSLIWEQKLINPIAPVTAIVSNDGKSVVTFDNWHSMGYGVDVLVYYNEKGELIKRHNLEEISPFPINTYEISISSIWWRCGARFIDRKSIEICFQDDNKNIVNGIYSLEGLKME